MVKNKKDNGRKIIFKTISESMIDKIDGQVTKVTLFNFAEGSHKFLMGDKYKNRIGTFEATWIRIYDNKDTYYDFITSSLFFVENKEGLLLLSGEQIEQLTYDFFAEEIKKLIISGEFKNKSNDEYFKVYSNKMIGEMKDSFIELSKYYSLKKQIESGRLNIEDEYKMSKSNLSMMYLKNLVFRKEFKDHKEEIIKLLE